MTIGERVKQLREAKGLGQRQLADMARIHHQILNRIEKRGHYPSVPNTMRLARALGVTMDYLCGMYDEETMKELGVKDGKIAPAALAMAGTSD